MKWIMQQDWNHVLFLHWQLDAECIKHLVPFELDLFEGKAVISIVPFQMSRIRFPGLPVVPFISSLWELNLRTYVKVNGVAGVYFFTLDTDSALGSYIANRFFHLPYRVAKIKGQFLDQSYSFSSERSEFKFKMRAEISDSLKEKTNLDRWSTDRGCLFTKFNEKVYMGTVLHEEWRLQKIHRIDYEDQFSCQLPIVLNRKPDEMAYCSHLRVRFKPFEIISAE
jgi:uncharacterized protein YqjF (DUF2071 family)